MKRHKAESFKLTCCNQVGSAIQIEKCMTKAIRTTAPHVNEDSKPI